MMDINLVVNEEEGVAGFDDWFDADDVEKIAKALNLIGFNVEIEKVDYEFKDEPILAKKNMGYSIPKTPENIFKIMTNRDKKPREVLEILGYGDRESDFVIVTMTDKLTREYEKWKKLDHPQEWADETEKIKAFAGYMESKQKISDKGIKNAIKKMTGKGCLRLADEKFPECEKEFNKNCLECQFGKEFIKTEADIRRFNEDLKNG